MNDPTTNDPTTNVAEFSVTEIAFAVKKTVEDRFGYVRVRGEISGYRGPHASGHAYFALKDEKARLEAVIWRGVFSKLTFKPEEGLEVIASGKVTTYPGSSKYQIVIDSLEPAGVGALMALLEERRKSLAAEGLFDAADKQLLPYLPKVIGVVTSPTGAVIRDILHRLSDRFPCHVVVWPVRVQGEGSGDEVAAALHGFNTIQEGGSIPVPDLIIVARGGGSLEDLWGFNDEAVVRAVAASDIPVISAVGHETDWTLIDHVADVRAPTPTAAAELAVPVRIELLAEVADLSRRLASAVDRSLQSNRSQIDAKFRAMPSLRDLMAIQRQRFDIATARIEQEFAVRVSMARNRLLQLSGRVSPIGLETGLKNAGERLEALMGRLKRSLLVQHERQVSRVQPLIARIDRAISIAIERRQTAHGRAAKALDQGYIGGLERHLAYFHQQAKLLESLSYARVLERGYAVVHNRAGGIFSNAAALKTGDGVVIEFADGSVEAIAKGKTVSGGKRAAKPVPDKKSTQGHLFED